MNHHSRSYRIAALLALVVLFASALRLPAATPRALAAAAPQEASSLAGATTAGSVAAAPAASTALSQQLAAAAATSWVFQGPAPELNAQQDLINVAAANEPVSGAVNVIAASPTNADLVYIGGSNGGVWKTTNATAATPTWTPLTDNMKTQSLGALALDPTDATGQTVVAGTGRFSALAQSGGDLAGLYYSTDGGATWTTTTSSLLSASSINGVAARGSTLMATSANGLFRSTTGALGTWTKISAAGVLPNAPAIALVGDPKNANTLYATFTGASGGIFRTDDAGATWINVTSGIPFTTATSTGFGISSATTAFNAGVYNDGTTSVVTVMLNGTNGNTTTGVTAKAVFRKVGNNDFTPLDVPAGDFSSVTTRNISVMADKSNSNLVYLAGYGCLSPGPFKPVVYRLDASLPSGSQATLISTPADYGTPHPDVNNLTVDANGGLWMGVHGGVYRLPAPASAASGTNYWVSENGNLGISEIHDIAYDHVSHVLVGGVQDNAVAFQSAPGSQTWSLAPSQAGDGGDVIVADIGGGQSLRYGSSQTLGGFRRYVYNAANALVSNTAVSTSVITDGQFITPLAVNAIDPQRLVLGGSGRVYESLNQGGTIAALPQAVGVTPSNFKGPIAYGGRQNGVANPDVLYIGNGSKIYARTTAGGALVATAALPAGATNLQGIVLNPNDYTNVFAVDNTHVYASSDGGASWSDITGSLISSGLSSIQFNALAFVSGASPYLAVGTRSGVFASLISNLGTWVKLGDNLPTAPVWDMAYDSTDDVLAISTLGRAAWLLPTASAAFVPSSVAPVLALTGPTAATEHATYQNSYSFTVNDPGDRFTINGGAPTITGGSLVAGSLVTTGSGGSFKVIFPDGPATASISLQVTDSTGLASNVATVSVLVANAAPVPTILGAPTSGSPGVAINLTSSVTDQSAVDQAAGFVYDWLVQKTVGTTTTNFATGSAASFSYTPDVAGTYKVYFRAKDKDGLFSGYTTKTITAASPNLTENAVSLAVGEGIAALNSGTYSHHGPAPLALSASVGTVTMAPAPTPAHFFRGDGNANDSAAGGTPGTINGGVTFTAGQVGQAFNFPGSGGAPADTPNVEYPAADFAPGAGDFSVAFGLKTTATGTQAVLGNRADASAGNFLGVRISNGILDVATWQDASSSNYAFVDSTVALNDGNFHHIVVTRQGAALNLYIDGSLNASATAAAATAVDIVGAYPFRLGAEQGSAATFVPAFAGLLDEVRIYNVALSPAAIAQDNSAFVAGQPAPDSALNVAGYWQLGEDDSGAVAGNTANATTLGQDSNGLNSALNLTKQGSPTYTAVDGSNGSVLAASFNGSTDGYILNGPVTTTTDNFGVEAWVKPAASTASPQIIVHNGAWGNFNGFGLEILNGHYYGDYGQTRTFDTGVTATADAWSHIALVRDGGVTKIYVNGSLVFQDSSVGAPAAATSGFSIGKRPLVNGAYFNGAIDDVRIFTFAPGAFNPQDLAINTSVSGAWSWSYATDDGPAQSQNVTITASTGVSGDTTSIPFPLTVDNNPPTASLSNSGPVSEGSTATVSFSGQSDPSTADTTAGFHYAYDFNNDGVFDAGDGTYANGVTAATATVPASALAEGPGTQLVLARIIDKDGGYTDYTTTITINNAPPVASVSGSSNLLVGQVGTFVVSATDPSAIDQAAGFSYSIDWGDGSTETIARSEGNGHATARHAYATTGNKTIQVTATDKDGVASPTAGSTSITVNALTTSNLQALIDTTPVVYLQPADDAALHAEVAAINGLSAPSTPAGITIVLGAGPYTGIALSPPDRISLDLAGNHTVDNPGTRIAGASPAVTVSSGDVFVQGEGLTTATDSPTVLVTGGHLTLGQNDIEESTGANNVAIKVTGGRVDVGLDIVFNVNGQGGFFSTYDPDAIGFPQGVDADLSPNTYQVNGATVSANQRSATDLASSANPSTSGQAVTFTANVDVEAGEQGPATGTVTFYDGATVLGSGTLSPAGGDVFTASFTTSSLSIGTHTITAVYGGNSVYVASSARLTQVVTAPVNHAPVAQDQSVTTNQDTAKAITLVATDADSDPLTYSIVAGPGHGTLTGTAPNVTYTPASGYAGSDSFTFKANDGQVDSNIATVSITVVHVNHAPVATNDSYSTVVNTSLTVTAPGVLSNDTDADSNALTAIKVSNPAHGAVTFNANGSFTYIPISGYVGSDSFTYKANDGQVDSNVATVSITIRQYNFTGFFGSVLNPPTFNPVNAGSNIAFNFGLGGNYGLNIFASGYPQSQQINCTSGAPIGTSQQVAPAANLSYSPTTGKYTYTAKTDKKWVGTCRQFNLRTADGTDHLARFKFK